MSVTTNAFQKVFIYTEASFGAGDGVFTNGAKIRLASKLDLGNITQNILADQTVRDDWDDAGSPPVPTIKNAKLDINVLLSGASRTSGIVDEDGLSKLLEYSLGDVDRGTANGAVDDSAGTSTTTTIYHNGALTFTAGDLIMIDGAVRRVSAVGGADNFTVDIPFSTVPADASVIYTGEVFTHNTNTTSLQVGAVTEDTEMTWLLKGGMPQEIKVDAFKSGSEAKATLSYEFSDWERGASLTPSTDENPVDAVVAGSGYGLQMLDNTGALYSPCVSEITPNIGIGHEWIDDIGGTGGHCGFGAIPTDSNVEMTLYQDGTLSKLEALVGSETGIPINVQLGSEAGRIVGVYYPEAFISEYPTSTDIGTLQGVKCKFNASVGYLYRF